MLDIENKNGIQQLVKYFSAFCMKHLFCIPLSVDTFMIPPNYQQNELHRLATLVFRTINELHCTFLGGVLNHYR
jgi:hypothetical protein